MAVYLRKLSGVFLLFVGIAGLAQSVQARDFSALQAELWVDLQPMGKEGPQQISHEAALKSLLAEAQLVFSGMIYGFDFTYRPSDKARNADETFTMTPLFLIPWGDKDFEFRESRGDDSTLYVRIRYFPKPSEIARLESWVTAVLQDASGTGFSSYFEGSSARVKSIQESCKDAVRNLARGMTHNKPSLLKGKLILSNLPNIIVKSGQFRSEVRVRIDLREIEAYRNY